MSVICGSCYVLVDNTEDDYCPRCHGPIEPTCREVLERFAEHGLNPAQGGVPIAQAQAAAREFLSGKI